MKVLMITSEWPNAEDLNAGKFVAIQAKLLQEKGIDLEVFHYRGNKKLTSYIKNILKARRKAKSGKFDLVHCQFGQSGLLGIATGLPMVVTFRGTDLNGFVDKNGIEPIKSKVLRGLSRWVATRADQVITVSHTLATKLPTNINYKVNSSSLNLDLFRPIPQQEARKQLGLDEKAKVFFFPADPGKTVKRFHLAEEAFNIFKGKYKNSILLCAGRVDFELMPYYYNSADAIVFTSSAEGSPNAIKEAMACNTPIVSVEVGDVKERIEFVSGCYIVEDNPQNIAEALFKVVDEKRNINTREAVSYLSGDNLTKELIELYKEVIEK